MASKPHELLISEEIAAETESFDEFTPVAGRPICVTAFHGDAAFSQNAVVKVVWKYDHATEPAVVLWSVKGNSGMPFKEKIINRREVDGIRKLALVCENGEAGSLFMSAHAKVEQK